MNTPPPPDLLAARLKFWLPELLRLWRRQCGLRPGPETELRPHEFSLITSGLRRLSFGLTRERHLAGRNYFDQPGELGAYLLYFWPVSYAQNHLLLRRIFSPAIPKNFDILDLGSGAGPLAVAGLDLGARSAVFADRHPKLPALAVQLASRIRRPSSWRSWNPLQSSTLPANTFQWIGLSHVLNELWPLDPERIARRCSLLQGLAPRLAPDGFLLLVEPALTATSRETLQVRNCLLEKGWPVRYPCLTPAPCPALIRGQDSCHEEFPWTPPHLLQKLARSAGLLKEHLKMTALAFSKPGTEPAPLPEGKIFRIVSEPLLSKNGRHRLIACGPDGRLGLSLHPRDATGQNEIFLSLRRGDRIRLHQVLLREQGLRLDKNSRLERIG